MTEIKTHRHLWGTDFPINGEPRKERGALGCQNHQATRSPGTFRTLDCAA